MMGRLSTLTTPYWLETPPDAGLYHAAPALIGLPEHASPAEVTFGFTIGGPVVLPHLYDGRSRTFFFGEYQGFRQVLGTTQVLAVPTAAERQGSDTTAFPGDTLTVTVTVLETSPGLKVSAVEGIAA